MFLATVTMLFAAFTSAYVVRRSGTDWRHVDLPSILWVNTGILAASSVVLELANRHGLRRRWKGAAVGLGSAALLGLAFLVGQLVAWRDLVHAGVYLPSNPHSSFFFMLTGAHGCASRGRPGRPRRGDSLRRVRRGRTRSPGSCGWSCAEPSGTTSGACGSRSSRWCRCTTRAFDTDGRRAMTQSGGAPDSIGGTAAFVHSMPAGAR